MATRADFYIQNKDGNLIFLGSTVNDYDGDFEEAKTVSEFEKLIYEKLRDNKSGIGVWYWPWKTSYISDLVFIFKHTPSFFNRDKGELWCKTNCNPNIFNQYNDKNKLCITKFSNKNKLNEDGYIDEKFIKIIDIPTMK